MTPSAISLAARILALLRRVHRERPGLLGGLFALLVGLWIVAGWLAASPGMIQWIPGAPTPFNTGLGFVLAGMLLLWRPARLPWPAAASLLMTGALMIGALLMQAQHVLGIDLGADLNALHLRAGIEQVSLMLYPGRMPWSVALAFFFVALAHGLMERPPPPRFVLLVEIICIAPGLIALLGLVDLALSQEGAYVQVYSRQAAMSVPAAFAFIAMSFGLWAAAAHRRAHRPGVREPEDQRIVRAAAFVMIPLAVLAGFGGFVAARNLTEHTMREALLHALHEQVHHVDAMLTHHLERISFIATQAAIGRALSADSAAARDALEEEIASLRAAGFAAVRFESPDGEVRAAGGYFAAPTPHNFSLSVAHGARLQWDGAYRISARTRIYADGTFVGYAVTEQPLPYLSMLFRGQEFAPDATQEGTTEVLIAYRDGAFIHTFPSRFSGRLRATSAATQSLAVSHSVSGRSGVLKTRDYRDRDVVAAFAPVGDTGLGMVVKIDVEEFYAPIARQFRLWAVLLWLAVAGGLAMLHRFIRPLAQRLVRSEAAARRISGLLQQKAESLEESEAQVRAILDSTGDAVLTLRRDGAIESCNAAAQRVFGCVPCNRRGRPITELIHTSVDPFTTAPGVAVNGYACRDDGQAVAVEMTLSRVSGAGTVCWVAVVRDVSERERAQAALRETHARLEEGLARLSQRNREMALLGRMSRALQGCRTETDAHSAVVRFGARLFPGQPGTLYVDDGERLRVAGQWNGGVALDDGPDICTLRGLCGAQVPCEARRNMVCEHQADPRFPQSTLCIPLSVQGEHLGALTVRLRADTDGETLAAHRHLAAAASEHIALALANIRLRDTLRGQSIRDPLTGLYNRRYLEEAYRQAEANAARAGRPLAVVLIDVDHFKRYNDTFGHEAGDLVLHNLGALLKASVREGDTACRFGGEEFALLLPGASLADGVVRAEELRRTIAAELQLTLDGRMLDRVTASFGVAAYPEAGRSLRALVRAADEALYAAKAAGRDRVVVASSETPGELDPAGA